jgi:hypothetical protein
MPNLLEELDELISKNLEEHGRYLTDPHVAEEDRLNEKIDALADFVPEDRWEHVRRAVLTIIRVNQGSR